MNRKVALSVLVGVLVVTAGCSTFLGDEDSDSRMILVNQDSVNHAVVVEISDQSGLVYSDGRTVAAESDLDLDRFGHTGEYDVTVTVDGNSTELTHTFQTDDNAISIGIDNEGAVSME